MPSVRLEDLTEFGRLAVRLDRDFAELARACEQIARVNLESDAGLDDGVKILGRVARYGQSIAEGMQGFAKALQEARDGAEAGTKLAAERAQLIQKRKQRRDELQQKLHGLQQEVQAAGATLAGFSEPGKKDLSEEGKRRIAAELERLQEPLDRFIEAAKALKAEAAGANFKRLERQADSMLDSLQATRRKIAQAISQKP